MNTNALGRCLGANCRRKAMLRDQNQAGNLRTADSFRGRRVDEPGRRCGLWGDILSPSVGSIRAPICVFAAVPDHAGAVFLFDNPRDGKCNERKEGAMRRRDFLMRGLAAFSAAGLAPCAAFAQATYPDRPIRLIIPFPPGGGFDAVGRPWADRIKPLLGTIVVENQGGGGSSLGAASVAHANPDGYTLLLGGSSTHITEAI